MFNLLVTHDEEAWQGPPARFHISRVLKPYTDDHLKEKFGKLDEASLDALCRMPAIFACEKGVGPQPKFGHVTGIRRRGGGMELAVDYTLIDLPKFLTDKELWAMAAELDIGDWEPSHTHWAVKDVDLAEELAAKGIILPPRFAGPSRESRRASRVDITKHRFDVAFSFPGEYRELVEAVAMETAALLGPHAVFYDNNYTAQLARPNLDTLLQDIYGRRAKLIVVFVGANYQGKTWPYIEWRAIRAILNKIDDSQRVMFVKVDDGHVDGLLPQDGYVSATRFSPAQIAAFVVDRAEFAPELPPT